MAGGGGNGVDAGRRVCGFLGLAGHEKRKRANLTIRSSVVAPTGIEPVFRA